jgi:hypothetical protein
VEIIVFVKLVMHFIYKQKQVTQGLLVNGVSCCQEDKTKQKNRENPRPKPRKKEQTSFYIRWPKALEYQDEGAVVRLFPVRVLSAWSADFLFSDP